MNIKEYLDILKDLWTPTNASKIRMAISNALEMMGNNLKENIDRQDNVENQFQDVLDETTGKDVINGPEIIAARNGESNLKARLDKENQEVTAQLAQITQEVDITVTVGTNGDYNTINQALNFLSLKNKRKDRKAEIKLLSGYIMQEQVFIDGDNYSWIKITSVDDVVPMKAFTTFPPQIRLPEYNEYSAVNITGMFVGDNNGHLPIIDVLFDMTDSPHSVTAPFAVANGAQMVILKGAGCLNPRGTGIFAIQGGKVYAMGAKVPNAQGHALAGWRGAYINFGGGDGSYAGQAGAYMDVLSTLNVDAANLSHATNEGIRIDQASFATAVKADLSYSGSVGANINYASSASLKESNINNCKDYGIRATSSMVDATDVSAKNCGYGIASQNGATINATRADVTGYTTSGLYTTNGGFINGRNAICQKVVGVDSWSDIRVVGNGFINANGATGGKSPTETNKITSSGIIFDSSNPEDGSKFGEAQTITLTNGWSGTLTVSKTSEGVVNLRGRAIQIGTTTKYTTIGTLPSEFKPTINTGFHGSHASEGKNYDFLIPTSTGNIELGEDIGTGNVNINVMYRI